MTDTLDIDLVLVPVDGSDESATAVEYAVAIAESYDATVHAVYVVGQDVVRGIEGGAVEKDEVAADAQSFIEDVVAIGAEHDVPVSNSTAYGFSTSRKTQHPGSVVLDTADELGADFVVVPRESMADDSYASQPLLSV